MRGQPCISEGWVRQPIFWRARQRSLVTRTGGRVPAHRCVIAPALPSFACHGEPRPCNRRRVSVHVTMNRVLAPAHTYPSSACHCEPVRTLVRQSVFPAAMPGKSVVLRANSQLFRIRREELLFGLRYRRSYGLPRRFAPRNDMLKFARCLRVQAPCSVAPRRHVLAAAEALLFFACHGNHAFATADTCPSSACHCEPVRTLVRQSASPQQYLASQ